MNRHRPWDRFQTVTVRSRRRLILRSLVRCNAKAQCNQDAGIPVDWPGVGSVWNKDAKPSMAPPAAYLLPSLSPTNSASTVSFSCAVENMQSDVVAVRRDQGRTPHRCRPISARNSHLLPHVKRHRRRFHADVAKTPAA